MEWRVCTQRHAAVRNFVANLSQLSILAISIELTPLRQTPVLTSFVDVIDYEPGQRRNVRVPRPLSLA